MLTLPSEFVHVVIPFAPLFSKRAFRSAQVLVMGAILDVHFINPSPVFCLDNTGDDGHPHTIRYSYLA